jgi:quinol-cytochrome oxidoreductase complex cytochrome b subunit
MELSKINSKKGIQLNQAFGAVLTLVLVAVLVIIAIFLFVTLGASFTADSAEANASNDMVTEFSNYTSLIGLVGTIIFLGLVIGVLVASFAFGGRRV